MPQSAYDRLVDRHSTARMAATKRLAAIRAQDVHQLAAKTEALWDMEICDFLGEAEAIAMGDFGEEEFRLLKSIRHDAAHLARGRS